MLRSHPLPAGTDLLALHRQAPSRYPLLLESVASGTVQGRWDLLLATDGTAAILREDGIEVEEVFKVGEGRPNIVDQIINKSVDWIINTPMGAASKHDEVAIRRTALENNIPTMTTLAAARAE